MAVGVFSDIGNTIAKFSGINATLSRTVAAKAGGRVALSLGALQAVGGGVGGVLGMAWFSYDAWQGFGKGFEKDMLLDLISSAGCVVGIFALGTTATYIGIPVGIVAGLISFIMVATAQLLKFLRTFSNNTEDLCKSLNGEPLEDGGMDRLRQWGKELQAHTVALAPEMTTPSNKAALQALIDRVDTFITDWDTYDKVSSMPPTHS